jgi:hypothetical protein
MNATVRRPSCAQASLPIASISNDSPKLGEPMLHQRVNSRVPGAAPASRTTTLKSRSSECSPSHGQDACPSPNSLPHSLRTCGALRKASPRSPCCGASRSGNNPFPFKPGWFCLSNGFNGSKFNSILQRQPTNPLGPSSIPTPLSRSILPKSIPANGNLSVWSGKLRCCVANSTPCGRAAGSPVQVPENSAWHISALCRRPV